MDHIVELRMDWGGSPVKFQYHPEWTTLSPTQTYPSTWGTFLKQSPGVLVMIEMCNQYKLFTDKMDPCTSRRKGF